MLARDHRRTGLKGLGGLLGVSLIVLACSGSAASSAPSATASQPSAAPSEAAAPSVDDKPLEIAYLSFAVANSYDAPMLAAAQAAAAAGQRQADRLRREP